ncbi:MAG: error-prone DNA polymerase, partial [Bdellovibrionia bacterium]
PENFYDLVIEVAIVRPGPIQGKMVHPYLKRRRKLEDSKCPDPRMEPILSRTLGVPLFQEQVMKIAMVMADFTPGEADELRRAIGAWRSSGSIEKMGNRLKQGLLANGLAQEFVDRIFQQIQGFAEYGFPESHAASFALLAYASSYLKCHYPAEFTCALLNSQPMGFYSSYTLVEDVKRQGVKVLPLNPQFSNWDCTLEQGAIRMGWRMLQGLGRAEADEVFKERAIRQFSGLRDFLSRVRLSLRMLNRLAMGDAFACYGISQREALWEILHLQVCRPAPVREQQLNLFQFVAESLPNSALFTPLSLYQAIQSDYESYHLSVKGHPMMGLRADPELKKNLPPGNTATLKKMIAGQVTRIAGLVIIRQRPPTAKGTMFATLEDEYGFADLILHAKTFEKYKPCFESSPFVLVAGKIQRDGELVNLLVSFVGPLFQHSSGLPEAPLLAAGNYIF